MFRMAWCVRGVRCARRARHARLRRFLRTCPAGGIRVALRPGRIPFLGTGDRGAGAVTRPMPGDDVFSVVDGIEAGRFRRAHGRADHRSTYATSCPLRFRFRIGGSYRNGYTGDGGARSRSFVGRTHGGRRGRREAGVTHAHPFGARGAGVRFRRSSTATRPSTGPGPPGRRHPPPRPLPPSAVCPRLPWRPRLPLPQPLGMGASSGMPMVRVHTRAVRSAPAGVASRANSWEWPSVPVPVPVSERSGTPCSCTRRAYGRIRKNALCGGTRHGCHHRGRLSCRSPRISCGRTSAASGGRPVLRSRAPCPGQPFAASVPSSPELRCVRGRRCGHRGSVGSASCPRSCLL